MFFLRLGSAVRSACWLVATLLVWSASARAHPGGHGGGSAGALAHAGAGIATLRPEEDVKLAIDFYGYLSGSAASGWRTGEPLAPGGKIPLFYNNYLMQEAPFDRVGLIKRDYWPGYRDFSYNPLWQPSQLGLRTQYRFVPTIRGTITAVYFGSVDQITPDPNPIELEELFVRWTPEHVPGLSLSLGRLLMVGSYATPFDQFPLEGFRFNGAAAAYEHPLGSSRVRVQLAGGRTPLGRSTAIEPINPELPFHPPFLDGLRERNHMYATSGLQLRSGLSFGILAGFQALPEQQSSSVDSSPNTRVWPASSGWQLGVEAGLDRPGLAQHVYVVHGKGDVEMAWGAPDNVYLLDPALQYERFSREDSALFQAIYCGYLGSERWHLGGGAWFQWRSPGKIERTYSVFNESTEELEPMTARTQDFRAAKLNVEPALSFGPAAFGVRLDSILYFDKKATTDTIEPEVDEALRRVTAPGPMGSAPVSVAGPSLWEREAVDSLIVSPFVDLRLGEILRLRASWSGAWYSQPIHRQGRASDFHANVTLSAWVIYRFATAEGAPQAQR